MNIRINTRSIAVAKRPTALRRGLAHRKAARRKAAHRERADGFTLVELLVSIAIIGIIASFLAGAVFAAQESARRSATEAIISKLHSQMAMRWEDYATRRVGVQPVAGLSRENITIQRVFAIQELMRFELPDNYGDIFDPADATEPPTRWALSGAPSLTRAYHRRVRRQVVGSPGINDMDAAFAKIAATNQSAECLYLIMTTGMIDETSGGEYFTGSETGDTDGDGMLEFIDGWGQPIEWMRWPTAFVSDLQPVRTADKYDRDPFNPTLVDEQNLLVQLGKRPANRPGTAGVDWGYRLTPLILSPGRDGSGGIGFGVYLSGSTIEINDPYAILDDGGQRGQVLPDALGNNTHEDNIHNHMTGTP